MALSVKFWGTRGSIPTPGNQTRRFGGNTSCVEVRADDLLLICDAGSGIRSLGAELMESANAPIEGHLFFTHSHWDHIQGFPFFAPVYIPQNRFTIYGQEEGDERFFQLLSGQMQSEYFPVDFSALGPQLYRGALAGGSGSVGRVKVSTCPLNHPGSCTGYAFDLDGKKVVYATDNEIPFEAEDAVGPAGSTLSTASPRPVPEPLVRFADGADLLIADGQYTDEEYLAKRGWGHSSCLTVVDWAVQSRVGRLAIFHHDPEHSDDTIDRMVDRCRERVRHLGANLVVFAAREGVELEVE